MKFEWELISGGYQQQSRASRAKVIGGWIVRSQFIDEDFGTSESMVFIPDPNHEWTIDD